MLNLIGHWLNMTQIKIIPRYVDHLWYPILVRCGGFCRIVEMQGRKVNEWNDWVASQK